MAAACVAALSSPVHPGTSPVSPPAASPQLDGGPVVEGAVPQPTLSPSAGTLTGSELERREDGALSGGAGEVTVVVPPGRAGSGPAAPGPGTAPALATPLSVRGNRIVDAEGRTVVLRGVQRDGTQGGAGVTAAPVTADELAWLGYGHAGSWHARLVRVPLGSAQWTGACPNLAGDPVHYRAAITEEVEALTAQGIVALLDLHTSTAGCTSIGRHAMPDAPISYWFWDKVASHFKDNPLVAFELYNEPHFVSDATWLQGTADASFQDCDTTEPPAQDPQERVEQRAALAQCQRDAPRYQAAGMQQLYDVVMRAAPGHLVVVDGPEWANRPPSLSMNAWAGNLVFGVHPYTCTEPGAPCNTSSQAQANIPLLERWLGLSSTAPVLVTEMGWPVYPKADASVYVDGARYYSETLAWLGKRSPAWGFVAFAFDGSAGGSFSLVQDMATYLPNSTGLPVYELLRRR